LFALTRIVKALVENTFAGYDKNMTTICAVRKLDRDDAEAWASLRQEALEAHPLVFSATIPEDPKALVESFLARLTSDEESAVFGAFIGGSLIGIVGIRRNPGGKERHKASIWGMYVTAGSRRNGVGVALLRAAIREARSWAGVEQIRLAVSEVAEGARKLYEGNGFQEWGREPRALCWEGRWADESHMVLDLRQSQWTA
jgi:GNAT superfamily N-acetyltransferase